MCLELKEFTGVELEMFGIALFFGSRRRRSNEEAMNARVHVGKKMVLEASFAKQPRPLSVPSCHDHMPVILHRIIGSTGEKPSYQRPLVPVNSMRRQQSLFLFRRKWPSVDSRV